jgi:hypothetical protein
MEALDLRSIGCSQLVKPELDAPLYLPALGAARPVAA